MDLYTCCGCKEEFDYNMTDGKNGICLDCERCCECGCECDSEEDEWFDNKYPIASCHRCEKKLSGATVVFCGGGGGACETWYCADCHEDGTDDCDVCDSEEEYEGQLAEDDKKKATASTPHPPLKNLNDLTALSSGIK